MGHRILSRFQLAGFGDAAQYALNVAHLALQVRLKLGRAGQPGQHPFVHLALHLGQTGVQGLRAALCAAHTRVKLGVLGGELAHFVVQLFGAVVQVLRAILQVAGAVIQLLRAVVQVVGAVIQLRRAVLQFVHAVPHLVQGLVQRGDVVHGVPQILHAAGGRQQNGGHHKGVGVRFQRHLVQQLVVQVGEVAGQQALEGLLHTGQGHKGHQLGLGIGLHRAVLRLDVGEVIGTQRHAHHRGKGGVHTAGRPADLVGLFQVVGELHRNFHMAGLTQHLSGGHLLAIQLIADAGGNRRGLGAVALIIHIVVVGVPGEGIAIQGISRIAFQVGDVGQAGAVGHAPKAVVAVQPVADDLALNAAVRVQKQENILILGHRAVGRKGHGAAPCRQGGAGNQTDGFFHGSIHPFRPLFSFCGRQTLHAAPGQLPPCLAWASGGWCGR